MQPDEHSCHRIKLNSAQVLSSRENIDGHVGVYFFFFFLRKKYLYTNQNLNQYNKP